MRSSLYNSDDEEYIARMQSYARKRYEVPLGESITEEELQENLKRGMETLKEFMEGLDEKAN